MNGTVCSPVTAQNANTRSLKPRRPAAPPLCPARAGAFGPGHRVYRSHFGNPQFAQRRQAAGAQEQQRGALLGLLQVRGPGAQIGAAATVDSGDATAAFAVPCPALLSPGRRRLPTDAAPPPPLLAPASPPRSCCRCCC